MPIWGMFLPGLTIRINLKMYILVETTHISHNYLLKSKHTVQATTIIIIKNPHHKIIACIIVILEVQEALIDTRATVKYSQILIWVLEPAKKVKQVQIIKASQTNRLYYSLKINRFYKSNNSSRHSKYKIHRNCHHHNKIRLIYLHKIHNHFNNINILLVLSKRFLLS